MVQFKEYRKQFPVLLLALSLFASQIGLAQEAVSKPGVKTKYEMTDGHFHLLSFVQETAGIDSAAISMKASGVTHAMLSGMPVVKKWESWATLRPTYYLDDDGRCYWYSATDVLVAEQYKAYKSKPVQPVSFHPFLCGINAADRNSVDHLKRMIALYPDLWEGIGEVMTRHDDLTALTYGDVSRANDKGLDSILVFAAVNDLPVIIHSDIGSKWLETPAYKHEIETAVKNHPQTRIVWAHAGSSRDIVLTNHTQIVETLLGKYPNLWIDISWVIWPQEIDTSGVINKKWVALIEKYPDRVIIGSDVVGTFGLYQATMQRYYLLLDLLSRPTAEKVASKNFLQILPKRVQQKNWYSPKN